MPLEATMMIIDNSEYMRNGDYVPTRFDAQSDAVNTVFQTKIDSNPENTVGLMTMAGKGPQVLVTHSKDLGQILQAIHVASNNVGGSIDIPTAIAVAQLALKHRENKNLRQRIIVFVASPLEGDAADEKEMVKLAKRLKKNNVAVDVVAFGDGIEETSGDEKSVLKAFVEAVNNGDNSHLVNAAPGNMLLSDVLISSPVLAGDRQAGIPEELMGGGDTSGAGPSNDFEFGVDPSLDPELAMALRMSMQEAQAREAAEAAQSAQPSQPSTTPAAATTGTSSSAPAESSHEPADDTDDDDEEKLLKKALAISEGQEDHDVEMDDEDDDEEDEDAAIARAIEMSMQEEQDKQKKQK
ncbi:hypothetical protein BDQ17DRAFT_1432059 [Cyathus striatus]|nr:hypothetical protein BDQ17DRAFT_1432059 [Cyathus striatus]